MTLFIPSLLAGDFNAFMVKIAVVVLLWLLVIAASAVDLVTGIAASKRLGTKKTTSWGLRRTFSKDLQYLSVLVLMLLIDIGLSALSQYLPIFSIPLMSVVAVLLELITEFISVRENTRKGLSPEEDKMDDIQQLAIKVADTYGLENAQKVLEILKTEFEKKKN